MRKLLAVFLLILLAGCGKPIFADRNVPSPEEFKSQLATVRLTLEKDLSYMDIYEEFFYWSRMKYAKSRYDDPIVGDWGMSVEGYPSNLKKRASILIGFDSHLGIQRDLVVDIIYLDENKSRVDIYAWDRHDETSQRFSKMAQEIKSYLERL